MIGWLQSFFGFARGDSNSPAYLFFSGPAIVASVFWHGAVNGWTRYRGVNCEVPRCPWIARKATAAGDRVCWKHHPAGPPTAEQVTASHEAALAAAGPAHDE